MQLTAFEWQLWCPGVLVSEKAPFSDVSGGLETLFIISCKENSCSSSLLWELWDRSRSNARLRPRSSSTSIEFTLVICFLSPSLACLSSGGVWQQGDAEVCLEAHGVTLLAGRDLCFSSVLTLSSLRFLPEEVMGLFLSTGSLEQSDTVFLNFNRIKDTVGDKICEWYVDENGLSICSGSRELVTVETEPEFDFESGLWVLKSVFLVSSICLTLLRFLTGKSSTRVLCLAWPERCPLNWTWGEFPEGFCGTSEGNTVLDLFLLSFASVDSCLFRQGLDDRDVGDDCVGLSVNDESRHVDWPHADSVHSWPFVGSGESSKTEKCLHDGWDTSDVLNFVSTAGFAVSASIEFARNRHSFLALVSQSSDSLRLFWDE